MPVNLNVLRARAEDVPKARAHLATLASFPTDAHASFLVFFNVEMSFVVAILTDRDALQTSRATLTVYLAPECFFSSSAWCVGGNIGELIGIVDAPGYVSPRPSNTRSIVQLIFMRAGVKVQMSEEVVWVQAVACGHDLFVGWRRARSSMICLRVSAEWETEQHFTDLAQLARESSRCGTGRDSPLELAEFGRR